ncbi:MAG: hypothetical protein S4CHLAM45_10160 [Chlamydiales bacterium]|nr:hypothetical protein [Chlamydiales bacterium]MCH9620168.1 hypothetical protein [Chlamydiales bacterium]MCH9623117.1 hypothetical protein [Chlamydiales bacterium]
MRLVNFLKRDIWRIRVDELPKKKALKIRLLRILTLISQGFTKRQVQQGASSLTYYTLLAIVPVIAFLLAVARGFLIQDSFKQWLHDRFGGESIIAKKLLSFAELSLNQTGKGIVAFLGFLLVLWAAIKVLMYMELVMNQIWEVKRGRSIARRFSDYIAILGFCPFYIVLTTLFTAYISTTFNELGKDVGIIKNITPVLFFLLNLIPLILSWLILTFLYIFIPNTSVRFRPALYAAFITSIGYQALQWLYFTLQVGVSQYNAVYGTFAAIPLFLFWVHIGWVIVLIGAKIAFAFQNVTAYEFMVEDISLSLRFQEILSVRIAHFCVRRFTHELSIPTSLDISNSLYIPHPLTKEILFKLVESGVLTEVRQEKEFGYQPAVSEDVLTIKRVIDMIHTQGEEIPLLEDVDTEKIIKSFEEFSELMEQTDYNLLLKEIE